MSGHRSAWVPAVLALGIGLIGCAAKKKVELEYEEPVTRVWVGPEQPGPTGGPGQAAPSPPPSGGPAQQYPQAAPPQGAYQQQAAPPAPVYRQGGGPAQAYPAQPYPQASPPAQAPAEAPPTGNAQYPQRPPQPRTVTDPSTGATTVVIPDQNPTTQTTLRRRTGWVRGGYD